MWLATRQGFFSIVKDPINGSHKLRARFDGDIERLLKVASLPERKIYQFVGTDYRFRAEITHEELVKIMVFFADDNDYDNFKNASAFTLTKSVDRYSSIRNKALHGMWDVMYEAQSDASAIDIQEGRLDKNKRNILW